MNVCADKNRCALPRSHCGDRFERFRTSKQTGRNPPKAVYPSPTGLPRHDRAVVASGSHEERPGNPS